MPPPRLLNDTSLERSSVVANNAMNRERDLTGVNSYAKDLGFDPLTLPDGPFDLITCHGPGTLNLPFRYLGADDQAGPNYTGQPAVTSHYTPL